MKSLCCLVALAFSTVSLAEFAAPQTQGVVSPFNKRPLIVLQRDKKSGIAMIVIGALLIAAYKAPVGHGAGGSSGFGEGDPTPVFLGGGLIVLGVNQMPQPPLWMPSITFVRRKPTIHWTVSQW